MTADKSPDTPQIDESALEKALGALASLNLSEEQMEALQSRLMVSPQELKQEVREEAWAEIEEELDLDDDPFPIELTRESDHTVTLGIGEYERSITIRYLHTGDFERMVAYIPDVVRTLYKQGPKALQGLTVQKLFTDLVRVLATPGKRAKLRRFLYQELALCLSNPKTGQIITADELRATCLPGQIIKAAQEVYTVNERFFAGLWAVVPGVIRTPLGTSIGEITKTIKSLAQQTWAFTAKNRHGGTPNGGSTNSTTPLPANTDTPSTKSEAWNLSELGGTGKLFGVETTEKAIFPGVMASSLKMTANPQEKGNLA
ncbi:MAG: hypothetical protein ACO1RX_20170 [Candidatus Sericytochromatia bacterium]